MSNMFGKTFVLLLIIMLLFIWPTSEIYEAQDDLSYMHANNSVIHFVDSVKDKGYISPRMYNDFVYELHATGNTYNIELEHSYKRYNPVYLDAANPDSFQEKINVDYEKFYNDDILAVVFPNNTDSKDSLSRMYKLTIGDYFSVEVTKTNRTNGEIIRSILNGGLVINPKLPISYGGMVANEDY